MAARHVLRQDCGSLGRAEFGPRTSLDRPTGRRRVKYLDCIAVSAESAAPCAEDLAQYYQANVVGRAYAFISAADGRSTDTARNARANLITNYAFTGERFKGFNLGGAMRWRAEPTIGYGVATSSAGATVLDLDKAYKGKEEFYVDAILGYRGKLKAFGGFSYRLQLNVRNVLNENSPIPVQTWTTGEVVKLATVEPRLYVFTFAVNF